MGEISNFRNMYFIPKLIDDMTFDYTGNQITKITDLAGGETYYQAQDFKPNSTLNIQYLYDQNGNMIADDNKGIAKIKYNFLNLPDTILFRKGGHLMNYIYDAAGTKLAVEYKTGIGDVTIPLNTTTNANDWTFDHVEMEHYNGNLRYTTEGSSVTSMRLLTGEGYMERTANGKWQYYYNLCDHLGNVRYTFDETGKNAGFTHYYPFGIEYIYCDEIPGVPGKEKYNGKELQASFGLNLYDYGWRGYDVATGRFTTMDPLCEKYYSISPYAYGLNNPVLYIDYAGLFSTKDDAEKYRQENNITGDILFAKDQKEYFISQPVDYEGEGAGTAIHREFGMEWARNNYYDNRMQGQSWDRQFEIWKWKQGLDDYKIEKNAGPYLQGAALLVPPIGFINNVKTFGGSDIFENETKTTDKIVAGIAIPLDILTWGYGSELINLSTKAAKWIPWAEATDWLINIYSAYTTKEKNKSKK